MDKVFDSSFRFAAGMGLLMAGSIFLVGAALCQLLDPPPAYDELTPISGRFQRIVQSHSSSRTNWTEIRLASAEGPIRTYIPSFGHLKRQQTGLALLRIAPGTPLTVLSDHEKQVAWEVRTQQSVVLPYADTVKAELETNKRMAYAGIGAVISGALFLLLSWRREQARAQAFF